MPRHADSVFLWKLRGARLAVAHIPLFSYRVAVYVLLQQWLMPAWEWGLRQV